MNICESLINLVKEKKSKMLIDFGQNGNMVRFGISPFPNEDNTTIGKQTAPNLFFVIYTKHGKPIFLPTKAS